MARSKGGVLGSVSGKFGSVVGYRLRGTDVIRGLPRITSKKPSINQLAHRARFKLIQNWRSILTPIFATTFCNHTHECSAQNAAHRFNAQIITGDYPDYKIDYSKVVISRGTLPGLKNVAVTIDEQKMMQVTWDKTIEPGAMHGDLVAFVAHYGINNLYDASTTAASRGNGEFQFQLKEHEEAAYVELYVTVVSDDRKRAADSVYVGKIQFTN